MRCRRSIGHVAEETVDVAKKRYLLERLRSRPHVVILLTQLPRFVAPSITPALFTPAPFPTYSCLLKGEKQPECQACQSALTVKHILIDCTHLSAVHQRYFRVDSLKELFEIVDSRNIIAFIKDINYYRYI